MLTNANKGTYLVQNWPKNANVIYERPLTEHCSEKDLDMPHLVFYQTNDEVRTPSQIHFKVVLIYSRNPIEKKFLKSNQPLLSYLLSSTGHSAHLGRMAGAA